MSLVEKPKGAPFDNGGKGLDGQYERYAVLPSGERKQFVRPYRDKYTHVGRLESLVNGVDSHQVRVGGCGTVTSMGRALSETYAAMPDYYGSTYCGGCRTHRPVAEFVWTVDGERVGS